VPVRVAGTGSGSAATSLMARPDSPIAGPSTPPLPASELDSGIGRTSGPASDAPESSRAPWLRPHWQGNHDRAGAFRIEVQVRYRGSLALIIAAAALTEAASGNLKPEVFVVSAKQRLGATRGMTPGRCGVHGRAGAQLARCRSGPLTPLRLPLAGQSDGLRQKT
jgi:hypothetical protein